MGYNSLPKLLWDLQNEVDSPHINKFPLPKVVLL
jgi:hypothetical protein